MFLLPLHIPLISAGYFGGVIGRMLDFVSLRIRRSDQGMTPSLSPGLRAQTVALHRRLTLLTGEFHRLARLAREGRLRVYPDRAAPDVPAERAGASSRAARRPRPEPDSPFGPPVGLAQGPMLPALPMRGFGWMLGFVPAAYRDALAGLLRNPEMVALIGASSSVARLLRSLCHGLGVARPEGVFPAPRRRGPRAMQPSQRGARTNLDGGAGGLPDTARPPGSAPPPREPVMVMSARARDRWWAERRASGCLAGDATQAGDAVGAGRFDVPVPGRCAKR